MESDLSMQNQNRNEQLEVASRRSQRSSRACREGGHVAAIRSRPERLEWEIGAATDRIFRLQRQVKVQQIQRKKLIEELLRIRMRNHSEATRREQQRSYGVREVKSPQKQSVSRAARVSRPKPANENAGQQVPYQQSSHVHLTAEQQQQPQFQLLLSIQNQLEFLQQLVQSPQYPHQHLQGTVQQMQNQLQQALQALQNQQPVQHLQLLDQLQIQITQFLQQL